MAKIEQGILGPYIGKVGTTVGYLWRGKAVVRAYVRHINYPNTMRQQAERDWFIQMVRFAATIRPALLEGLRMAADQERMYESNWFVKHNKAHFHRQADGSVAIDYQRLAVSAGAVAPVAPTEATAEADGVLAVRFDGQRGLHRSRATDRVHLLVYNADLQQSVVTQAVERRAGRIALRLPDGWQGMALHCYLFATDAHGNASPTTYTTVGEPLAPEPNPLMPQPASERPTTSQVATVAAGEPAHGVPSPTKKEPDRPA